MDNSHYLGVVSHHSLEEWLRINNCFIVCVFLIETLWLLTEFVPHAFSVVWCPDFCLVQLCTHMRISNEMSCFRCFCTHGPDMWKVKSLFGFGSETQRWPNSTSLTGHPPPWLLPTHPDSSLPTHPDPPWHTFGIWPSKSNQDPVLPSCHVIPVYPRSDPPVSLHDRSTYTGPDSFTNWTFIQRLQYARAWAYSRKRETRFLLTGSFHSGWVRNYTRKQMPGIFLTVTLQWRKINRLKEQRLWEERGGQKTIQSRGLSGTTVHGILEALGKILSHKGGRLAGM